MSIMERIDWWVAPLTACLCLVLQIVPILIMWQPPAFVENALFALFVLSVLWIIGSGIWHLAKKRRKQGILSLVSLVPVAGVLFVTCFILLVDPRPDNFAKKLTIPDNIELYYPLGERLDSRRIESPDLILYDEGQPGLYGYDLFLSCTGKGSVYLKAYEITKGTQLSVVNLAQRSCMQVWNDSDSLALFRLPNHFTIFEGDWGDPYAARFEVWFAPINGDPVCKLFEKNFVIEGWQR